MYNVLQFIDWDITLTMLMRLLLAIFVGGIIGIERKSKHKPAGMITNMFVCLGATIVAIHQQMLVIDSIELLEQNKDLIPALKIDMGRMNAQVISGIGFLGGGVIIYAQDKVKGITTATILWVLACIGLLIGSGYIVLALIATGLMLFALTFIRKMEGFFVKRHRKKKKRMMASLASEKQT